MSIYSKIIDFSYSCVFEFLNAANKKEVTNLNAGIWPNKETNYTQAGERQLQIVLENIPTQCRNIMDVPSGRGIALEVAQKHFPHFTTGRWRGIDINPESEKWLKNIKENAEFVLGDATRLPEIIENDKAEAILAVEILPDLEGGAIKFCESLSQSLQNNGTLVMYDYMASPGKWSLKDKIMSFIFEILGGTPRYNFLDIKNSLEKHGLSITKEIDYGKESIGGFMTWLKTDSCLSAFKSMKWHRKLYMKSLFYMLGYVQDKGLWSTYLIVARKAP